MLSIVFNGTKSSVVFIRKMLLFFVDECCSPRALFRYREGTATGVYKYRKTFVRDLATQDSNATAN